jgi:transcription factor SPN1
MFDGWHRIYYIIVQYPFISKIACSTTLLCFAFPYYGVDADNDSDDDGPGLFDSDGEDEPPAAKKAASKPLSKRERMEALQAKKRQEQGKVSGVPSDRPQKGENGYQSEDSYDSAEYVRTNEDMDFIDTEGDDADAVAELYAEQTFDDERGEAMEEPSKKNKIKGAGSSRGRSERAELEAEADDDDNPLLQAVKKMQRKKRAQKKFSELEDDAKPFLARMEQAADEDEEAVAQKRPAVKKLGMLVDVCETMTKRDMIRPLLDLDLLSICKRWIQPLPNGTLGNITVRQRVLQSIGTMTGENGITAHDLKRSEFGKVVMSLYMHKSETPAMKRQMKSLIEQWSRPIFQKSGNMRDLERVHKARGGGGLSQISRMQQQADYKPQAAQYLAHRGGKDQDLNSLIKSGSKGKTESGINRVRVPYSKGFQYSVRPQNRIAGDVDKRRQQTAPTQDAKGKLGKRITEKGRKVSKNVRSHNVSVEGRVSKS